MGRVEGHSLVSLLIFHLFALNLFLGFNCICLSPLDFLPVRGRQTVALGLAVAFLITCHGEDVKKTPRRRLSTGSYEEFLFWKNLN